MIERSMNGRKTVVQEAPPTFHDNPFSDVTQRRGIPPSVGAELFHSLERIKPDIYLPQIKAKGGEHLVYEFQDPKHADVVYKVNFSKTFPVLAAHYNGEIAKTRAVEDMEEDMLEQQGKLRELRTYFGFQAVPVQRFLVRDVPVSKDVVNALKPGWVSDALEVPDTIPAWINVQRRLEMPAEKTVSLNGYYPESPLKLMHRGDAEEEHVYDVGHDILIGKDVSDLDDEEKRAIVLDMYKDLHRVAEKAEDDPAFREKLADTVRKMIAYTEETENVLDLAGKNNVVLLEGEKAWELKMPDALFAGDMTLHGLDVAIRRHEKGEKLLNQHAGSALNPLNTVRVINALAVIAGIPDRLRVRGLENVPAEVWRKSLAKVFEQ